MKYVKRMSVITMIILAVMWLASSTAVRAAGAEDLRELWSETRYYPITPESDEWAEYGLWEALEILNPPEELLRSFSTEELAHLMMEYPYLWLLTAFDETDDFFEFLENNCDIYNELMSRDDGVLCLAKEYQNLEYDVLQWANNGDWSLKSYGYFPAANAETFGCRFIWYMNKSGDMDQEENELFSEIIREKTEVYESISNSITKRYLNFEKERPKSWAEEMKEQWYETHYYPLPRGSEEWYNAKCDFFEFYDLMNPPLDLLPSMSTQELAKLMQDYPDMDRMMIFFDEEGNQDYSAFFGAIESDSDIFYELLRREDGITCLLEEYRARDVEAFTVDGDHMKFYTEIFGCQFIRYYAHHFTESEYALASQIIEEKREQYSTLDNTKLYYLDLPEIEAPTGEEVGDIRTNYMWLEEVREREDRRAIVQLQQQSKENSVQTETPDTEDSNATGQEENNESITTEAVENESEQSNQRLLITIMIAVIGVACVAGGIVFICRRRKAK